MDAETVAGLLQFSDGLFPAGSYAHSFGMESYAAAGKMCDAGDVECFVLSYLQASVAPADVVAALASRREALCDRPSRLERCLSIDQVLNAMKTAGELRDASRQMGRQVLRIATNLGEPFTSHGLTPDLFRAVERDKTPGHHAMAFGAVAGVLAWSEFDLAYTYLYSTSAGIVGATLRLLSLGQLVGQQILWNLRPFIVRLAREIQEKEMADIWSFAPAIEIASMRHETLDARLFRS